MANSLLFSILMKMDAGQAKAELASFTAATSKAGAEGAALGNKLKPATQSTDALGRANQQAAGSVGNLLAQFNDIGVMIAAGQNPLQLAIQQGSQINQVIGPMGAAGAFKALGGAVMGMLNPINFVTLAVIAGGAAFVQWIMSGEDAAKSFEDRLKDVADALDGIEQYDFSNTFTGMSAEAATIRSEFETILGVVRQVEAASLQASVRALKVNNPLADAIAKFEADRSVLAQIGAPAPVFDSMGLDDIFEARYVLAAIAEIQGETREELLKSLDAAAERIALIGYMTPEVQQQLAMIAETLGLEKQVNEVKREAGEITKQITKDREKDRETAAEILADLQSQAELNATVALYGEQSAEAAAMRAEQERAAFVEMVNALDVTEAMRLEMVVAYDSAQALAGVDFASGIGAGADEAARMGGNLAAAANAWLAARSAAQDPGRLALEKYGARGTATNRPIEDGEGEIIRFRAASRGVGAARSPRGAGAAQKEADSVAKLIEKLQAELDISRELDPVQQEMARYRDQLAKATDAESEKVRELIRLREEEKQKTEQLEYIQAQTGNALIDGLMGAADAGERLVDTLARAALQAALLGEGPLSGLFGGGGGLLGGLVGGGGGGGIGSLFDLFSGGSVIGGLADGGGVGDGMIYGAGGPRDDLVPFWGSPGEFVVNARATHRHRALLEQINSGQFDSAPAFANGGVIGGGAGGGSLGGSTVFNAYFDLTGAQGDDAVRAAAKEGMDAALREYSRRELPSHVRRISADPSVARY